jgi:hypothetical protein
MEAAMYGRNILSIMGFNATSERTTTDPSTTNPETRNTPTNNPAPTNNPDVGIIGEQPIANRQQEPASRPAAQTDSIPDYTTRVTPEPIDQYGSEDDNDDNDDKDIDEIEENIDEIENDIDYYHSILSNPNSTPEATNNAKEAINELYYGDLKPEMQDRNEAEKDEGT